ncbi:MAG: acylphosphatase [Bryobacteraceae bacterium]
MKLHARRWYIAGRVQGVGFRYFAHDRALELGLRGWARNLDDGRVEVYASGTDQQLDQFRGALHTGPRMADVRSVEELEAAPEGHVGFSIR